MKFNDSIYEDVEKMERKKESDELLENAIKNTMLKTTKEIGLDFLEVGIDTLITYDIVKDIPIVGILRKLHKGFVDIHDLIFSKKVIVFSQAINNHDISQEVLKKHLEKLEKNPQRKFAELQTLIMYIEKNDKFIKSKMMANFYFLYISCDVDDFKWRDFNVYCDIVNNLFIYDLAVLINLKQKEFYSKNDTYDHGALRRLNSIGLVEYNNGIETTNDPSPSAEYYIACITEQGKFLCENGLDGIDISIFQDDIVTIL